MSNLIKATALLTIIVALFIQQCPGQYCQDSTSTTNLPKQIKICYKQLFKKSNFLMVNTLYALGRLSSTYNIKVNGPCPINLNIRTSLLNAMNLANKNLTTWQSLKLNKDLLDAVTRTLRSNSAKVSGSGPIVKTVLKDSMAMINLLDVVLKKVQRLQSASSTVSTTAVSGMRKTITTAAQLMQPNQITKDIYCRVEKLNAFALDMRIDFYNMSRSTV